MSLLDLFLNHNDSLLYETSAIQETEDLLVNSTKILNDKELILLKEFIRNAPESINAKHISPNRKKHFLDLIDGKGKPLSQELYKINIGFVKPYMDNEEFYTLADKDIIALLLNKRIEQDKIFKDAILNWEEFVLIDPYRAEKILRSKRLLEKKDIWIATANALAYKTRSTHNLQEMFKTQWDVFASKGLFVSRYIKADYPLEPITDWINQVYNNIEISETDYLEYWHRIWNISLYKPIVQSSIKSGDKTYKNDWLSVSINDTRGKLAEGLLNALYKYFPKADHNIPNSLKKVFNLVFESQSEGAWLAQLNFSRHYRNLYLIDKAWTLKNLIPSLNYTLNKDRATRLWTGFLYNPNLNYESFIALKPLLMGLIDYWDKMFSSDIYNVNSLKEKLVHLITIYKILYPKSISNKQFQNFMKKLAIKDLERLFILFDDLLTDPVQNKNDDIYWDKTLKPFFDNYWPGNIRSEKISIRFLELSLQCPRAFSSMQKYIISKNLLTSIDINKSRFIGSISYRHDTKFIAPLSSIENSRLFFDVILKCLQHDNSIGLIHSEQNFLNIIAPKFLDIFTDRFPHLVSYQNFKKVKSILAT